MKTTLAYILIILSVLLSKAQFDGKIPLSPNHYLIIGNSALVIPLLMQTFLFLGLKYLPEENSFKKVGKIIFVLLSVGYLFTAFLFFMDHEYANMKMYFFQFLIAVLFSMYCVPLTSKIKNTTGFILRIFSVLVFIYAVTVICYVTMGKRHFSGFEIRFFIVLSLIPILFWILAQKLNPIVVRVKRKFYLSILAFVIILFVWAKDITFQKHFIFRGQELSYSHALFNNSLKSFFNSGHSYIYDNERRKRIEIDSYMNSQCEKYIGATSQNKDATQLKKMILEVVKNDFNYFELYKSEARLDSIAINKVVEHKNSIFNIMPYGDCGY